MFCANCGNQVNEGEMFCSSCGAQQSVQPVQYVYQQPAQPFYQQPEQQQYVQQTPEFDPQVYTPIDQPVEPIRSGNVPLGILGAFLFSIAGGAAYFVAYQAGIIAGICGFLMFFLASIGYRLFARTKSKNSVAGLITALVCMLVMIFVAEYFCVSFEIFKAYKEEGYSLTIFNAIAATPAFLEDEEIFSSFISDLGFAYVFGAIATVGDVIRIIKSRKRKG